MANPRPHYRIDLEQIAARNQTARHMIAGFSAEMPMLADFWRHLDTALADNLTLCAEVTRLTAELTATRMDRANLLAAIRATIAAHADGEADPLSYLRDELDARQMPAQRHGRPS
jgi:predicted DNA-binding ribbon-helix-helix protein